MSWSRIFFRLPRLRFMRCHAPRSLPVRCHRPLLVRCRAQRNYNNQNSLYVLSNTNSPSSISPLRCSIPGKTALFYSSSYDKERSGKFEQLDKPSYVSDLLENIFLKISIHLSFLKRNLYMRDLDSSLLHASSGSAFFIVRPHWESAANFPSTLD